MSSLSPSRPEERLERGNDRAVRGSIQHHTLLPGLRVSLPAPACCAALLAREGRRLPDSVRRTARLHAAVVVVLVAAAAGAHRTVGERQRRRLLGEEALQTQFA